MKQLVRKLRALGVLYELWHIRTKIIVNKSALAEFKRERKMANTSKAKSGTKAYRQEQLEQLEGMVSTLKERFREANSNSKKLGLLTSVAIGLYEEADKLSKKAPAERVTDLMLEQVNDVIRETKELITNDTYVQRLNEFVAAGDNPELRDVVVVLRQLRQGMQRYEQWLSSFQLKASEVVLEAQTVAKALEYTLRVGDPPTQDYIKQILVKVDSSWFRYNSLHRTEIFSIDKLDHIDIHEHFSAD